MARTLLIGLDGATWTILDPYMERGLLPNLQALTERGTRAQLRSIMPPLTPPAWTSLMTGKHPGRHGVFDFFQKEDGDSVHFRFATSLDVRADTIWSLASDADLRVISLNFPLMFPAPDIDGFVVPGGMMPWRQLRLGCHPAGLFDRLKQLPGFKPKEMLDMELEVKAVEGCPVEEQVAYVEAHIQREARWMEVARHLMTQEDWDLAGVMFDGIDKLQHLCWRFIDPAFRPARPTEWEQTMIDRCEAYFASVDAIIGELVALAGADASVVLASDHGFGPTRDVFHVNAWLEQEGYLFWADGEGQGAADDDLVGFAEITRHVRALDWSRTVAYAATPSSQGIHVVPRVPGTDEPMPPHVRERLRAEIAGKLLEVRRPHDGEPLITEAWTRERAFAGPFEEIGPDVSMVLADGGTMSILPGSQVVTRRTEARGHHRWEGMFLAAGAGIRAGAQTDELVIVDVAPLVLHRLGLEIPDDLAGRLPVGIFEPDELAAHPPRMRVAAAYEAEARGAAAGLELDPEEQAGVMQRLRALGYVE